VCPYDARAILSKRGANLNEIVHLTMRGGNGMHGLDSSRRVRRRSFGERCAQSGLLLKNLEGQRTIAYEDENSFQQHLSVTLADACGG
jgi:hypothetical protein